MLGSVTREAMTAASWIEHYTTEKKKKKEPFVWPRGMRSSNPGETACQTSPLPLRSAQQALELVPSPENEDLLNPAYISPYPHIPISHIPIYIYPAKASRLPHIPPVSPVSQVSRAPARTCLLIRKWKAGSKKASVLSESKPAREQMTLVMFNLMIIRHGVSS